MIVDHRVRTVTDNHIRSDGRVMNGLFNGNTGFIGSIPTGTRGHAWWARCTAPGPRTQLCVRQGEVAYNRQLMAHTSKPSTSADFSRHMRLNFKKANDLAAASSNSVLLPICTWHDEGFWPPSVCQGAQVAAVHSPGGGKQDPEWNKELTPVKSSLSQSSLRTALASLPSRQEDRKIIDFNLWPPNHERTCEGILQLTYFPISRRGLSKADVNNLVTTTHPSKAKDISPLV
ncbi:hypothetical protein STEG23_006756, partial [Scotinomys teguina]